MLRNRYARVLFTTFLLALIWATIPAKQVSAAYDGGNLVDSNVFLDSASMSIEDIQNFLSNMGSGLSSRSFVLNCYGADSKERQWYTAAGAPCDQNVPASTIIYYASQIYGINPKVVLATLQKEQSLITSPNPTEWQINQAMGYGCPTSGGCGASTFFYQIDSGVWVLRYHYERARGNNDWWSPSDGWVCGTAKAYYNPNLYPNQNVNFIDEDGVHYRTHFLVNAATSSLYCYTPHAYNNPQGLYGLPQFGTTGRYYSGSYNFVRFYELWFGSTREYYAWSVIAQNAYTDSTKQAPANLGTLQSNKKYFVTVTIQNTGNVTWHKLGGTPTALGTTGPRDRLNSAFCDETWLACNRPALLHEYTVSPGQYGSFEFWITAPPEPGNFNELFAPLVENLTWMDSHTISFPMSVPAVYSWTPETQYAYTDNSKTTPVDLSSLSAGQKVFIGFKAKNTGNTSWPNAGNNPVRAATLGHRDRLSSFCDVTWLGCNRPANMQETLVAPGQTGTFEFWYKAPPDGFTGYEQFGLMSEGYLWMNDPGMSFYTSVPKEVFSWLPLTQYAYTDASKTIPVDLTTITAGQKVYVGFQATNTGNTTWTNSGANQIRVGTTGSRDRMSKFCDDSWLGCNRPSVLKESSVAPGQTGTFEFWYRAPNTSFIGFEQFSLMIEGSLWMNDPGMSFYTEVR